MPTSIKNRQHKKRHTTILAVLFFLSHGPARAAVAFDAHGTTNGFTGGATTSFTNTSLTIGAISNGVFIAIVQFGGVVTSPVIKWDSTGTFQTPTLIASITASDNLSSCYIWGLINPHTGNKTFSLSWTGAASYAAQLLSFSGADQAAFATTFKNVITDASTPGTAVYPTGGMSITTVSGDAAVMGAGTSGGAFGTGGTGTQVEDQNTNVSGDGRYSLAVGTSTNLAANVNPSVPYCGVGFAIAQVSAAVPTPMGALIGVGQ